MFRPLITEPVVLQITIVIAILLGISVWQRLKVASGIVIAVYAIYMISFVSANTKLKASKPIRLAVHNKKIENDIKPIVEESEEIVPTTTKAELTQKEKVDFSDNIEPKKYIPTVKASKRVKKKALITQKDDDVPFKILNMFTGTDVINRSIIEPKNTFTTDAKRVYFLSGVQNRNDSKVLFHKWYHDGKLKSKIQMESKRSFNWRSWSYITVNPQKIGDWQVVIEDQSGVRYDSLSFIISDYNI